MQALVHLLVDGAQMQLVNRGAGGPYQASLQSRGSI